MVTSKRKFDFEGSYLKRLGERIALLLHIRPHKVRLDPISIKTPTSMLAKIGGCTCGREYRYTRLHVWPRILARIRAGTDPQNDTYQAPPSSMNASG